MSTILIMNVDTVIDKKKSRPWQYLCSFGFNTQVALRGQLRFQGQFVDRKILLRSHGIPSAEFADVDKNRYTNTLI